MKRLKMIFSIGMLFNLLSQQIMVPIQASEGGIEAPEPYMVSKFITMVPLDRDYSIQLIQDAFNYQSTSEQNLSEQESIIHQLTVIAEEYERINQEIAQTESGEQDSLTAANAELEYVIEVLYEQAIYDYEGFSEMSAEDQFLLISENESVLEWQQYINDLTAYLNELIVYQADLEGQYSQLEYDLEIMQQEVGSEYIDEQELNQSLLYPYSEDYLSPDTILLNQETTLDDFHMQLNSYLDQIVPDAYRKVSFDQIYEIFKLQIDPSQLEAITVSKTPIQLDADTLHYYSYAHELSLQDIETVAQFGLDDFYLNEDMAQYLSIYQDVIQTKEDQFSYFKSINQGAFDLLQSQWVTYLNQGALVDAGTFEKVQNLQNKYQVKLVFFDDASNTWVANTTGTSGYFDEYFSKTFDELEYGGKGQVVDDLDFEEVTDDNIIEETDQEKPSMLNSIKDKLVDQPQTTSSKSSLPKPSTTPKLEKNPKASSSSSDKETKASSLPSTGESNWVTYLAVGLGVVGGLLLIYNRYLRYQEQKKYRETKLD